MRVGIDATSWQNSRGYGRYTRGLLSAMVRIDAGHDYVFFFDDEVDRDAVPDGVELRTLSTTSPTARTAGASTHRRLRDMWRIGRAMSDPELDVLLFPTVYSFVPVRTGAKKIVVIHDTIPEAYPELAFPDSRSRTFWRVKSALARWQSDVVVTVSEYSRAKIHQHFNIPAERIFVVGEAADPVFRRLERPRMGERLTKLGIAPDRRCLVYVGGFSPHKNVDRLVSVFARVVQDAEFDDVRLVLVGEYENEVFNSDYPRIKRRVEAAQLTERVVFTGYLPDEELAVLLNTATALALPSLIEGFGLPAIEAAACGCPVIATLESPLPDILGGGGIFIDPTDAAGLGDAMTRVLRSEETRRRMSRAGLEAAGRCSWDQSARQLLDVINGVCKP